jgi:glycosyltransferase 2 family protein
MLPATSDDGRPARVKRVLIRVAVSAVILGFLAYKVNWATLAGVVSQMHLGLTLTAFALLHVGQSFSSWRWKLLAEPLGFRHPYKWFRAQFYIGTFFNLFLPTSIGGDVYRAIRLGRSHANWLAAYGCVVADRVAGVAAMLVMACAATPALIGSELPAWVLGLPWIGLVGMAGTLVMLPWLAGRVGKFRALFNGLGWSDGRQSRWWAAVGLSVIVQAFATLQVILLSLAMGLTVPWTAYVVVVPLVTLLTMVMPSLNGIGVREGGLILFLAPYGVTMEQALTLGMGWFALGLGVGLVGGVIYLFFDRQGSPGVLQASQFGREPDGPFHRRADEGRTGQRQAAA